MAESGLSNVSSMQVNCETCNSRSKQNLAVNPLMQSLAMTGNYSLELVSLANDSISKTAQLLDSALFKAGLAVSHSNVGSSATVERIMILSPEAGNEIIRAWPADGLRQSFTDTELDDLLETFDSHPPHRRQGAWQTFYSPSSDAIAQTSHSMRDILAKIIAKEATNAHVEIARGIRPENSRIQLRGQFSATECGFCSTAQAIRARMKPRLMKSKSR